MSNSILVSAFRWNVGPVTLGGDKWKPDRIPGTFYIKFESN